MQDMTQTDLINLRRTIYLTIMSSMDFEEAGHKLMKIPLAPGQEMEIVTMILECCSQEKTYIRCPCVPAPLPLPPFLSSFSPPPSLPPILSVHQPPHAL